MDRARHLPLKISVLLASLLMTSCAATPSAGPVTPPPTTALSATAQADKTPPTPIPATTSQAQEVCAPFLPGAQCTTYESVSAASNGKALPWAANGAVKAQLTSINGALLLTVRTPCGPLGAPVVIKGNVLTVAGKIAMGASGCIGAAGDQREWVQQFMKRPIAMTYANGKLLWTSGADSLTFKTE